MSYDSILQTLVGANASLMAITVALVALIPAFVETARVKSPTFMTGAEARRSLKANLLWLRHTIWMFGASAILATVGLFCPHFLLFALATILFLLGLSLLIYVSYLLTQLAEQLT